MALAGAPISTQQRTRFLQTDLDYRWPPGPLDQFGTYNVVMNALTLGRWERRKEQRLRAWQTHGDVSVWPFFSRDEYDQARRQPSFLAGSR